MLGPELIVEHQARNGTVHEKVMDHRGRVRRQDMPGDCLLQFADHALDPLYLRCRHFLGQPQLHMLLEEARLYEARQLDH
ncbi:hypothetical protein D3C86_1984610 [compost metagenome]